MNRQLEHIVTEHTEKLQKWYDLLQEIMPDYFFRTFTGKQLEDIIPLLFNLDNDAKIQRIERHDSVTLIYLQNAQNNLRTTSRMMRSYNIAGAVAHKSTQQIVINNKPQTLVIEFFKLAGFADTSRQPLFSCKAVMAEYKKLFGKAPATLKELYSRIVWDEVDDLTIERLVERLKWVLETQDKDYIKLGIEKNSPKELRLTLSRQCGASRGGFYYKIIEAVNHAGFDIGRAYFRDLVKAGAKTDFNHMPVMLSTLYINSSKGITLNSPKVKALLRELKTLSWTDTSDLFHTELVIKHNITITDANLLRAAAEFVHAQLSFVDRNAYNCQDIYRLMAIYPEILKAVISYFKDKFDPHGKSGKIKNNGAEKRILRLINSVNTGVNEKDTMVKTILTSVLNFVSNICKTNFYSEDKACLAFRLSPAFMDHYATLATSYNKSFPSDRPFGVFYFYRDNAIGFQVRFSEIARGGWRTVVPKQSSNELERRDNYEFAKDEIFREVFILAHTQHMKNKDIYEGGSKMITLLNMADKQDFETALFNAQRAVCAAFVSLINYDSKGKLKDPNIVDHLGTQEIIEIGPDENMFDPMINWIGDYAAKSDYTLKAGLISGKPDRGINHKEFGVTSFGVHQFLLRTLQHLNIDPHKDQFSLKISGGPFGDVAGNELKLLLNKHTGKYDYPNLKIVAITDGPAAAYDPEGLDRDELSRLMLQKNLDSFNPEKLRGDGAFIVFSQPIVVDGMERYRLVSCKAGKIQEKMISRDDFMSYFQNNIYHQADLFVPCGGRPSTINIVNWQDYLPAGKPSSRAIVEGANSFITPEARQKLQDAGILIVKDASANKCGVITSSYEILSGLMLTETEFKAEKQELVKEVMEKLKSHAQNEAAWLFNQYNTKPTHLTELTERLSRAINGKNVEVSSYLDEHPELITDKTVLEHLPQIFSEKYADRIAHIPQQYKKAIVAVELAARIIYQQNDSIDQEIKAVL
jgi:glutamate dehydrogenase